MWNDDQFNSDKVLTELLAEEARQKHSLQTSDFTPSTSQRTSGQQSICTQFIQSVSKSPVKSCNRYQVKYSTTNSTNVIDPNFTPPINNPSVFDNAPNVHIPAESSPIEDTIGPGAQSMANIGPQNESEIVSPQYIQNSIKALINQLFKNSTSNTTNTNCQSTTSSVNNPSVYNCPLNAHNVRKSTLSPVTENTTGPGSLSMASASLGLQIRAEKIKFNCDICDKSFAHKSTLQNHKRKHTKEKVNFCAFCNRGHNFQGARDNHQKVCKKRPR